MSTHRAAIERVINRHGITAKYTRLDDPVIEGIVRIANINFVERPNTEPDLITQMAMRWVVLASDLAAIGIARPYEGDRVTFDDIGLVLTVNRYGLRIADNEVVAFDLEATGR